MIGRRSLSGRAHSRDTWLCPTLHPLRWNAIGIQNSKNLIACLMASKVPSRRITVRKTWLGASCAFSPKFRVVPLMSNLPTSWIILSMSTRVGFGPVFSSAEATRRPERYPSKDMKSGFEFGSRNFRRLGNRRRAVPTYPRETERPERTTTPWPSEPSSFASALAPTNETLTKTGFKAALARQLDELRAWSVCADHDDRFRFGAFERAQC